MPDGKGKHIRFRKPKKGRDRAVTWFIRMLEARHGKRNKDPRRDWPNDIPTTELVCDDNPWPEDGVPSTLR